MFVPLLLVTFALTFHQALCFKEKRVHHCQGKINIDAISNPKGDIFSPFYEEDGDYPDDLSCEYNITAPDGYRIKLTFEDMDIDPSSYCTQDALAVMIPTLGYDLETYCGTDIPPPYVSDYGVNVLYLRFKTDFLGSGRGFHIKYEVGKMFEKCPTGQESCHNKKCFDPSSQKCDGVDDCGDATDEIGCGLPAVSSECGKPPIVPDNIYGGHDRVIGGKEAIPGSWPWQISLQYRWASFSHGCGGSLINSQWIVTAAHCFRGNADIESWRVHVGKHHKFRRDETEQVRYLERIILYPNATGEALKESTYYTADIALAKLSAPVQFTDAVRPACLPYLGWDLSPGTTCYATGWGETRGTGANDALKQVEVDVRPENDTECSYDTKAEICVRNKAGFQSTCHGDSGGPLACRLGGKWYVMGADSHGTESNFLSGLCSMLTQRTVFTKLSDKADWIQVMVNKYS